MAIVTKGVENEKKQEDKQPEKSEEAPKKREIIIDIIGEGGVEVSPDSQHASIFELVAVLNAVIGNFNVKQEEKR